jgi:hypothetical protein
MREAKSVLTSEPNSGGVRAGGIFSPPSVAATDAGSSGEVRRNVIRSRSCSVLRFWSSPSGMRERVAGLNEATRLLGSVIVRAVASARL